MRFSARTCIGFAVLVFFASVIGFVLMEANASSIRTGRDRITSAVSTELSDLASAVVRAQSRLGSAGVPSAKDLAPPLEAFALVEPAVSDRPPVMVGEAPWALWSRLRVRLGEALAAAENGRSSDVFLREQGDLVAIRVEAAAPRSGDRIAVGLERVDRPAIERIAERAAVVGLSLVRSRFGSLPLGATGMGLAWRRNGLSNRDYARVGFGLSGLTSLIACLMALYAQRETSRMAASEAAAKELAGHDLLSGLPNRLNFTAALDGALARAERRSAQLALLYIDLDGFKEVNDRFGHQAGDRLIVAVGQRIMGALRGGDRVARLGGDEFAVLLTEIHQVRDAEIVCKRLSGAMQEPFELGGSEAYVGLSIGIALFPSDATDRDELMRRADLALYRAKNEGRGRYAFFESRMGDELRLRRSVEDELKSAIENDQLAVMYQPIFESDAQTVVGFEALVRWPHPEWGVVPPDQFIGLAEDRGLIASLGEWVLRRACLDAAQWPGLKVAVNVSPIQFRSRDFVSTVARVLSETGRDPSLVELELTESVVIENADGAEEAMIELRAMGVSLALDDFGTGYSSLIYLRRFPFDKIKIDRSFLESMEPTGESAIIVQSIVSLGRALGLTVTAEGLENDDQLRILKSFDCHQFQGFALARPMDVVEAGRFLAQRAETGPLSHAAA